MGFRRAVVFALASACSSAAPIPDAGPQDPEANIFLVAGTPSHGPGEHEYYAGCQLLAGLLRQSAGVVPAVIPGNWPDDPSVFDRARAIVFFMDGNQGHPLLAPGRLDALAPHVARGAGLGAIHWAVHFPGTPDPRVLEWWGAHYSDAISVNPTWTADYRGFVEHPVANGVSSFTIDDEWYYNLAFHPDEARITRVLSAVPPDNTRFTADAASHPGRAETTAWLFARADGGKSFGFTGAHYHRNWSDLNFRRVVVQQILFVAGFEIPETGANVALDPADLEKNLDPK